MGILLKASASKSCVLPEFRQREPCETHKRRVDEPRLALKLGPPEPRFIAFESPAFEPRLA